MTEISAPRDRNGFETAIICALKSEADAVEASFDKFWDDDGDPYGRAPGDTNSYTMGVIGRRNVVLAFMPGMGKGSAASVAASIRSSFGGIKLALLVGVCAGVPNDSDDEHQILLGDVVISKGVIQYDFGRQVDGGFKRKTDVEENLGRPNQEISSLLAKLESARSRKRLQDKTFSYLTDLIQKTQVRYPGAAEDKLYKSTYRHKHHDTTCARCEDEGVPACDTALKSSCSELKCDEDMLIRRGRLERAKGSVDSGKAAEQKPFIHYGLVASGDTVMKSGKHRDMIAAEGNVIAFEMEGAGVWNNLPSVIIKGVCDYGDSHKSKAWQGYASATAAACMKAFLTEWSFPSQTQSKHSHILHEFSSDLKLFYCSTNASGFEEAYTFNQMYRDSSVWIADVKRFFNCFIYLTDSSISLLPFQCDINVVFCSG